MSAHAPVRLGPHLQQPGRRPRASSQTAWTVVDERPVPLAPRLVHPRPHLSTSRSATRSNPQVAERLVGREVRASQSPPVLTRANPHARDIVPAARKHTEVRSVTTPTDVPSGRGPDPDGFRSQYSEQRPGPSLRSDPFSTLTWIQVDKVSGSTTQKMMPACRAGADDSTPSTSSAVRAPHTRRRTVGATRSRVFIGASPGPGGLVPPAAPSPSDFTAHRHHMPRRHRRPRVSRSATSSTCNAPHWLQE